MPRLRQHRSALSVAGFVLVTQWVSASLSAQAMPRPRDLNWVRYPGAESCISAATLTRRLAALGLFLEESGEELGPSLEGWVERDAERALWRARIRVFERDRGLSGERIVESAGEDCASLSSSILLVLQLLLEGTRVSSAPVASADVKLAETTDKSQPSLASTSPMPMRVPEQTAGALAFERSPKGFRTAVLGAIGLASGVNPSLTYGLRAGVVVQSPRHLSLSVHGSYWAKSVESLASEQAAPAELSFRGAQADVAVCADAPPFSKLTLSGCWGGFVGRHRVSSSGLESRKRVRRIYGGPSAALRFRLDLGGPWWLVAGVEVGAVGRRDRFTYAAPSGDVRVAFDPPLFTFFPDLGVALRL